MLILAIDLVKFNSMCCFFDTDSQESRFQLAASPRLTLTTESQAPRSRAALGLRATSAILTEDDCWGLLHLEEKIVPSLWKPAVARSHLLPLAASSPGPATGRQTLADRCPIESTAQLHRAA